MHSGPQISGLFGDSSAGLGAEHNRNILESRTKLFKDYADNHFMPVYGEVSEPLLDLLKLHGVGYKWFSFVQGLEPSPVIPPQILVAAPEATQPV